MLELTNYCMQSCEIIYHALCDLDNYYRLCRNIISPLEKRKGGTLEEHCVRFRKFINDRGVATTR